MRGINIRRLAKREPARPPAPKILCLLKSLPKTGHCALYAFSARKELGMRLGQRPQNLTEADVARWDVSAPRSPAADSHSDSSRHEYRVCPTTTHFTAG